MLRCIIQDTHLLPKRWVFEWNFSGTDLATNIAGADGGKEEAMYFNYYFAHLSSAERELLEMILLEEMEIQAWFTVTYSNILGEEIFLTLQ